MRMHVVTHLAEKYEKMRTPENGWTIQEAGMADDIVGSVVQKVKDMGIDDNTIIVFTTDTILGAWRPDSVRGGQRNGP